MPTTLTRGESFRSPGPEPEPEPATTNPGLSSGERTPFDRRRKVSITPTNPEPAKAKEPEPAAKAPSVPVGKPEGRKGYNSTPKEEKSVRDEGTTAGPLSGYVDRPRSLEAERSVVGASLQSVEVCDRIRELHPDPAGFYYARFAVIWSAICRLRESGVVPDVVTVGDELKRTGQLQDVGGVSELVKIITETPTTANGVYYARIVADRQVGRGLIDLGASILSEYKPGRVAPDPWEMADRVREGLERVSSRFDLARSLGQFDEVAQRGEVLAEYLAGFDDPDARKVYPTGLGRLDKIIGGLRPGELIVVAGRPGSGKSAVGLTIGLQMSGLVPSASHVNPGAVLVYELEMSRTQTLDRIVGGIAGLPVVRFQSLRPDWSADELARIVDAAKRFGSGSLHVDTTPGITVDYFRRTLERRIETLPGGSELRAVVIDYPAKFRTGKGHSRTYELEEVFGRLKESAKEYNVPVVALHQLNRGVESRPIPRPVLSDLRDSGSVEQEADIAIFCYRPEYYNPENDPAGVQYEDGSDIRGVGDLIVEKSRNGSVGIARQAFRKDPILWADLATIAAEQIEAF